MKIQSGLWTQYPIWCIQRRMLEASLPFLENTKDSDTELELGVFDLETNRFIGMCTLENINHEYSMCELGYWLSKAYVGKGYMAECVRGIIQYAKKELRMKSINAFVIEGHDRSIALLERLGFEKKELLENDTENKGVDVNRLWYKLIL